MNNQMYVPGGADVLDSSRNQIRVRRCGSMDCVPDYVEEAERDAAVDPAAQQHRHPQRRPPRRRAPDEVLLSELNRPGRGRGRARRGGCERRCGREGAERPRRPAGAREGFRAREEGAPEERAEGGDDAQHGWRRRRPAGRRGGKRYRPLYWIGFFG